MQKNTYNWFIMSSFMTIFYVAVIVVGIIVSPPTKRCYTIIARRCIFFMVESVYYTILHLFDCIRLINLFIMWHRSQGRFHDVSKIIILSDVDWVGMVRLKNNIICFNNMSYHLLSIVIL